MASWGCARKHPLRFYMAKPAKSVKVSVEVVDVAGQEHNGEVAKAVAHHLTCGYELISSIYCTSTMAWPAHIMLIFAKKEEV